MDRKYPSTYKLLFTFFAFTALVFTTTYSEEVSIGLNEIEDYLQNSLSGLADDDGDGIEIDESRSELDLTFGSFQQQNRQWYRIRLSQIESISINGSTIILSEQDRGDLRGYAPFILISESPAGWSDEKFLYSIRISANSSEDAQRVVKAVRHLMKRFGNSYLQEEEQVSSQKQKLDQLLEGE